MVQPICTYIISLRASERIKKIDISYLTCVCAPVTKHATNSLILILTFCGDKVRVDPIPTRNDPAPQKGMWLVTNRMPFIHLIRSELTLSIG